MNKKQLIVGWVILFFSISTLVFSAEQEMKDNIGLLENWEKICATAPSIISEEQFYKYEDALIMGFTGSGGHFLGKEEIEWLLKMESFFKTKGIKLKDEQGRHFVIANSYFNNEMYDKALEEFKNIKDHSGIELTEWMIKNRGIKNGIVKISEYDGKIPYKASEVTRIENEQYLFITYFKGPVYRYDKKKNKHAIVYAPEFEYDWCDKLSLDSMNLIIELRDGVGVFIFDNLSNKIYLRVSRH